MGVTVASKRCLIWLSGCPIIIIQFGTEDKQWKIPLHYRMPSHKHDTEQFRKKMFLSHIFQMGEGHFK